MYLGMVYNFIAEDKKKLEIVSKRRNKYRMQVPTAYNGNKFLLMQNYLFNDSFLEVFSGINSKIILIRKTTKIYLPKQVPTCFSSSIYLSKMLPDTKANIIQFFKLFVVFLVSYMKEIRPKIRATQCFPKVLRLVEDRFFETIRLSKLRNDRRR